MITRPTCVRACVCVASGGVAWGESRWPCPQFSPNLNPQDHVKNECVKRLVNCKNLILGCVEVVPLDEMGDHLARACKKRVVECRLDCGQRFLCDTRHAHEVSTWRCGSAGVVARRLCF